MRLDPLVARPSLSTADCGLSCSPPLPFSASAAAALPYRVSERPGRRPAGAVEPFEWASGLTVRRPLGSARSAGASLGRLIAGKGARAADAGHPWPA